MFDYSLSNVGLLQCLSRYWRTRHCRFMKTKRRTVMKTKTFVKVLALARNHYRTAGLTLTAMLLSATGVFAQVTNSLDCNQGGHGNGCPMVGVYPPGSNPLGVTYGEWTARWWQWLLSIPGPVNTNLDTTGANCAQGQSGPVWFLAGRFSS